MSELILPPQGSAPDFVPHETHTLMGVRMVSLGGPADEPRYWTLPSGVVVQTLDAFPILKEWLTALNPRQAIAYLSMMSAVRISHPDVYDRVDALAAENPYLFRDSQFSVILRTLLSDETITSRVGGRDLDAAIVRRLCLMVTHSTCEADRISLGWPFLQRVSFAQFWDQDDYNSFSRGLILLRYINELLPERDRFDLNSAFKRLYGIGFQDFVFLCFSLFAVTTAQPGKTFGIEQLVRSDFDIDESMARAFYDLTSLTYEEFRRRAAEVAFEGYDLYNLNPLVRWPLVRFPEGDHIVPIPRFLLERATFGIYYDFFPRLEPAERSRFGTFWGNIFAAYVGELMRRTENFPDPIDAETALPGVGGLVCDWVVEDDDSVLLIECKTHGFNLESKVTGREASLRADISREESGSSLARAVLQLLNTHQRLRPTREGKRFAHLIVVLDHVHLANTKDWLNRLLREEASRLSTGELPEDFEFQVTDVAGFEVLCRLVAAANVKPATVLLEKLANPATRELELSRHCWSLAPEGLPGHPLLDEVDIIEIGRQYHRSQRAEEASDSQDSSEGTNINTTGGQ